jgi:glyoxylase-like metal-dependent hydrolase (beta-lactamase superfamily II)
LTLFLKVDDDRRDHWQENPTTSAEGNDLTTGFATVVACREYTLSRISLSIPIPGFSDFITPWLLSETGGRRILVDPGPACSIPLLIKALRTRGVTRLDLVLITHIHIDHSGGTGLLLRAFPEARVAVHARGVTHLVNPTRLWASTIATLGEELARSYGEIAPVPESSILDEKAVPDRLQIVETPGHSQHHRAYIYMSSRSQLAFTGEAAGVYLGGGYLRPATPPRFFYETTAKSIQILKARLQGAKLMLYGHYGYTDRPIQMLDAALNQIHLWKTVTKELVPKDSPVQLEETVRHLVTHLCRSDPFLAGLATFPADVLQRELYFLRNSARGFVLAGAGQE